MTREVIETTVNSTTDKVIHLDTDLEVLGVLFTDAVAYLCNSEVIIRHLYKLFLNIDDSSNVCTSKNFRLDSLETKIRYDFSDSNGKFYIDETNEFIGEVSFRITKDESIWNVIPINGTFILSVPVTNHRFGFDTVPIPNTTKSICASEPHYSCSLCFERIDINENLFMHITIYEDISIFNTNSTRNHRVAKLASINSMDFSNGTATESYSNTYTCEIDIYDTPRIDMITSKVKGDKLYED